MSPDARTLRVERRSRRGNYTILFGVLIVVLIGFGALALDMSYLRLAETETQDVADAASQAAVVTLRRTGSASAARSAAERVLTHNLVAGQVPHLVEFEMGKVDGSFASATEDPHAARVVVGRALPMLLAPMFHWTSSMVRRESVSATRPLQVILVLDITPSWKFSDFQAVNSAAAQFLDVLEDAHSPDDMVGMITYTGRYAIEQTSLRYVDDALADGTRGKWSGLMPASRAGYPSGATPTGCNAYGNDNFTTPSGGCFPHMWRRYTDEVGVDHSVALELARTMFAEQPGGAYRAVVMLTDGVPAQTGNPTARTAAGFTDSRWRWTRTSVARSSTDIQYATLQQADQLYLLDDVDIWTVSHLGDGGWLEAVARGDGHFVQATHSSALPTIFRDIAESLPVSIIQ